MKKHKDTKAIESTAMRISKVQRDMELSEYNRAGILKSQQKPSEAFIEYVKRRKIAGVLIPYKVLTWMDKHCTLKAVKHGK